MKRVIATVIISILVTANIFAQKDTLHVLFVGNSYTYYENLPQIVSLISDRTKTKLITQKTTIGGAKLSEHWKAERGLKTKAMIEKGKYDIVVLQEYSMGAINEPDSLKIYSKLFCDLIKKQGSTPCFYLTWAREKVPQYQDIINRVHSEVAKENHSALIPVGKAWALARQLRPDMNLFTPDGSHPSPIGTFLTACIFTASLSGEIPEKLPSSYDTVDKDGQSIFLMRLDPLDVVFCQMITNKIVFNK